MARSDMNRMILQKLDSIPIHQMSGIFLYPSDDNRKKEEEIKRFNLALNYLANYLFIFDHYCETA
jgi:hypothetical protein